MHALKSECRTRAWRCQHLWSRRVANRPGEQGRRAPVAIPRSWSRGSPERRDSRALHRVESDDKTPDTPRAGEDGAPGSVLVGDQGAGAMQIKAAGLVCRGRRVHIIHVIITSAYSCAVAPSKSHIVHKYPTSRPRYKYPTSPLRPLYVPFIWSVKRRAKASRGSSPGETAATRPHHAALSHTNRRYYGERLAFGGCSRELG